MPFFSQFGFACSCNKKECDECNKKYLIPTNADLIRAMTDEKLAKYLAWLEDPQACYVWELYENTKNISDWLEWLKKESDT